MLFFYRFMSAEYLTNPYIKQGEYKKPHVQIAVTVICISAG